jgi:hypothetical protein
MRKRNNAARHSQLHGNKSQRTMGRRLFLPRICGSDVSASHTDSRKAIYKGIAFFKLFITLSSFLIRIHTLWL